MLILLNKLLQYINLFKFNFINTNKFLEMFKVFKEKKNIFFKYYFKHFENYFSKFNSILTALCKPSYINNNIKKHNLFSFQLNCKLLF